MKLIYAKLWLKKYIKYNQDNLDENKLNRAIINLSHRVYKSHGQKGHNIRQSIRAQLIEYSKAELAKYDVAFKRPLRVSYTNRRRWSFGYWLVRLIRRTLMFLIKVVAILVLLYIIYVIIKII